jgi:hypothetical protein
VSVAGTWHWEKIWDVLYMRRLASEVWAVPETWRSTEHTLPRGQGVPSACADGL